MTNLNLMTPLRWIAYMPTQTIDPTYKSTQISFNLTGANIPAKGVFANDVSIYGYSFAVPGNARQIDTHLSLTYMLDSSMSQYTFLNKWLNMSASDIGQGRTGAPKDFMVPFKIMILSEFKNEVAEFTFNGAWLKEIGPLTFDYQDSGATPMKHGFMLQFFDMQYVDKIAELGK